jgi:hypothetical protein
MQGGVKPVAKEASERLFSAVNSGIETISSG